MYSCLNICICTCLCMYIKPIVNTTCLPQSLSCFEKEWHWFWSSVTELDQLVNMTQGSIFSSFFHLPQTEIIGTCCYTRLLFLPVFWTSVLDPQNYVANNHLFLLLSYYVCLTTCHENVRITDVYYSICFLYGLIGWNLAHQDSWVSVFSHSISSYL